MSADAADIRCRELVELVTAYLEGDLDEATAARVRAHLDVCPPCVAYVEQMRRTVVALGAAPREPVPGDVRAALLDAFRHWEP